MQADTLISVVGHALPGSWCKQGENVGPGKVSDLAGVTPYEHALCGV